MAREGGGDQVGMPWVRHHRLEHGAGEVPAKGTRARGDGQRLLDAPFRIYQPLLT